MKDVLSDSELKSRLYVTAAFRQPVFDPDNFYTLPDTEAQKRIEPYPVFIPERFVPIYLALHDLPRPKRIDALTATAALPYGLTKSVSFDNRELVDGGVVDNCPILPLVFFEKCDVLVVVDLSPWGDREEERRVQDLKRLMDLASRSGSETMNIRRWYGEQNDPPQNAPIEKISNWPRIRPIAPKQDLGGFFKGTMNFSMSRSRKLVEQGYGDADAFLSKHGAGLHRRSLAGT